MFEENYLVGAYHPTYLPASQQRPCLLSSLASLCVCIDNECQRRPLVLATSDRT